MAKNAKKEKSGGGSVAGIVVVTLLAAGGGAGFGFYLSGDLKDPTPPAKAAATARAEPKPNVPNNSKLLELRPMIASLAEPKDTLIRLEGSIVLTGEPEGAAVLAGKITEDIVAYLKTTSLSQFEGASGFQYLREDLNDRARMRGGDQVRELVIHGMVVE